MTAFKRTDDILEELRAYQTAKCQPKPNDPASSNTAARISRATQDATVFMAFIACSLVVSRYHVQNGIGGLNIALLIFLRGLNWFMGNYVIHRLRPMHDQYNLPNKRHDCAVASLLAICAWVLYHEGQIGWAFVANQATSCYWIGYWLEWWTGIVALLFSVFGCSTGNDKPYTLGRRHMPQAWDNLLNDGDDLGIRHCHISVLEVYRSVELGRV